MFALAMTLVVIVSSLVLLYQFWAGSLAEADTAPGERSTADTPAAPRHVTLNKAA
jgi:hypothetical protein